MMNAKTPAMPACGATGLSKDFYCLELIFNSCPSRPCKDCPIRDLGRRGMKLDRALKQVKKFTEQAKVKGFKGLEVHLIGGDSLEDWNRFVDFCNGVWKFQKEQRYPIQITATTCGFCLDGEKETFLLENSWHLRLIFRWNGSAGRRAWNDFSVLKYHPMTREVDYCVIKNDLKNFSADVQEIAALNKRIALEFPNFATYFELLKIAERQGSRYDLFVTEAHGDCTEQLCTVDIHGDIYSCRYFSPERLTFSSLRNIDEEFDKSRKVNAACPVAPYFSSKTN